MAGGLPPLGDRPRGSRKGQYPLTPLRARWARGCSGDMKVGRGFTAVARRVPRLAGLVRLPAGWQVDTAIRRQASWLAQGAVPLDPTPRQRARGSSEDMQLGRKATAARQQASWLAIKASVDLISRWPLALQKYPSYAEATHHARCAPAYRHPGKGRAAHSSPPQKFPRCTEASHPARGAPASRQLRGSRAAIGSGGKKARPF